MIHGSLCKTCGRAVVPPREICPYCGLTTTKMTSIDIRPEGKIVSFSILQMPPVGFDPPVLLALVELEHGATVLCLGEDRYIKDVAIGSPVVVYYDDDGRLRFLPSSAVAKTTM